MNLLLDFVPQPLVKAIGWTLLHSLWQGLLIALVLALLLIVLQRRTAAIRYFLSIVSLFTFLVIASLTFITEYSLARNLPANSDTSPGNTVYATGFPVELTVTQTTLQHLPEWSWTSLAFSFEDYFYRHIPLIVLLWSLGIAICILRFIGGYAYTQRLKHYKTVDLPENWQITLDTLATSAGVKQAVRLVESALVKVPMVIGHLKPMILLPIGTVTGLPAEQVEAILAHELAHIYRKDYLVNIFQSLVEIVFFYHPAIWWISSKIREEREHCCDDIALNICGNSLTFAKALANLENFYSPVPSMAMGFPGNGKHLLTRIQRLIHEPKRTPNFTEGFLAACVVMISLTAITVSAGSNMSPENGKLATLLQNDVVQNTSPLSTPTDTTENTFTFKGTKKGKRYNIKAVMQRGTIVTLFVNGKRILDAEKSNYYDLIYALMEDVPAPPAPVAAPARIDPGFPVDPVVAPKVELPEAVEEDIEDIDAVLAPASLDIMPETILTPMPPMPAIAPLPSETLGNMLRMAFEGDTSQKWKGDFVYHFTGTKEKNYKITIKDGLLTELKVDGKNIPKDQFKNYLYIIDEIDKEAQTRQEESIKRNEDAIHRYNKQLKKNQPYGEQMQRLEMEKSRLAQERATQSLMAQEERLRRQGREMEKASQEHERARAKHDESRRFFKELISILNTQMKKDKLVKENKNQYIQLNTEGLFIDNVKQPELIFKKYKELIEKKSGKPLDFMIQYYYGQEADNFKLEQDGAMLEHERAMREHEGGMAKHLEAVESQNELVDLLNTHLKKENLLKNDKQYHIRISPEGLYIDQVKQPDEVFYRYKELIEKQTGKPFVYTFEYNSRDNN